MLFSRLLRSDEAKYLACVVTYWVALVLVFGCVVLGVTGVWSPTVAVVTGVVAWTVTMLAGWGVAEYMA